MNHSFKSVARIRCEKCCNGYLNYQGKFKLVKVYVETHILYLHECDNPRCKTRDYEPNSKFPIYTY